MSECPGESCMDKSHEKTNAEALAEVIEKGEVTETTAPEDMAASLFMNLLPRFDAMIGNLSKGGLRRVLIHLVKNPLMEINFKMDPMETQIAGLAQGLIDTKTVIVADFLNKKIDEQTPVEEKKEA